jgi:hypothetical protein
METLINSPDVIPAKAGISNALKSENWIPALRYAPAGMTN